MTNRDHDETWARIAERVAAMPNGKGREVAWLASKTGMTLQRLNNWKTRGVPASSLPAVAQALGWSVNRVLGLPEPQSDWPFETISRERFQRLTPRQAAMVELAALHELERIEAAAGKQQASGR